jgi:eukaryotic-like serine/threonine-protein kinase
MGVVLEAWDRDRKHEVAVKMLRATSPVGMARLKQEFRALEGLVHPNVVRLFELHEEAGRWFFTMELVRGVSFLRWVRRDDRVRSGGETLDTLAPPPEADLDDPPTWDLGPRTMPLPEPSVHAPCDADRLREVLPQITAGLMALHAAGKVHRDVKPSNVMVTPEGRAVILDPGLVAAVGTQDRQVMGTVAYMAPEQMRAGAAGPAADFYALGVMLFEALTGHLPFEGPPSEVVHRKQSEAAPRPSRQTRVPADLDRLCAALLDPDPTTRAGGADVLAALGIAVPLPPPVSPAFRGRHAELARLATAMDEALAGRAVGIVVTGESGVGKSALLERFLREVVPPSLRVLAGRCREAEHVPFRALDEVLDEMARVVGDRHDWLSGDGTALRLLPSFAALPGPAVDAATDPVVRRREAFAAVKRTLRRLEPVVLAVDDWHAADEDSIALLEELLRPEEPVRLLFVATARAAVPGLGEIALGPLPVEEARQLASDAGAVGDAALRWAIESAGHPLFLLELLRQTGTATTGAGLDAALTARIGALPADHLRVVELLAVHGAPAASAIIGEAAGLSAGEVSLLVTRLRAERLVRSAGDDALELYHDRVRAATLVGASDEHRRGLHGELGAALEAHGAGAATVARHFWAAGEGGRAYPHALRAAREAEVALAFSQAADLYQLVLGAAPPEEKSGLVERIGECYVNLGRGGKAAASFLSAARGTAPERALALRCRAAQQLLASGRVAEGLSVNDEVLEALGVEAADLSAWRLAALRVRARFDSRADDLGTAQTRLDALWSVAGVLSMTDMVRASAFQTLHLAWARRLGDPLRLCRAIAAEALFSSTGGTKTRRRTARLLEECGRYAMGRGAYAQAVHLFVTSICRYSEGKFRAGLEAAAAAQALLEQRCVGVFWERAQTLLFRLMALDMLGRWDEVGSRVAEAVRDARERGDLYTEAQIGIVGCIQPALLTGRVAEGLAELDALEQRWGQSGFEIPHYNLLVGRLMAALWQGEAADALAKLDAAWEELQGTFLGQVQFCRIEMRRLRATALVGCATLAPDGPGRSRVMARLDADLRAIREERVGWGGAVADLLQGAAYEDVPLLRRAAAQLDALDLALFAGAAESLLGQWAPGAEAAHFAARSAARFAKVGVGVAVTAGVRRAHAGR